MKVHRKILFRHIWIKWSLIFKTLLFSWLFLSLFSWHIYAQVISQANWSLLFVDSQELIKMGPAVNSFDGDGNTFWHTRFSDINPDPPPPHEIRINLGSVYNINGFRYLPRQDGVDKGRIKQYEFYVSTDGTNWGTPVATGTFANNAAEKEVFFAQTTGQFIRLRALSEVNNNPWTTMAEINVLGNSSQDIQSPDWTSVVNGPFDLTPPTTVPNPVISASSITDVPAKFVADSFLFYENNTWYLFVEVLNKNTNQGDIGVATSSDGLHWIYRQIVLNESWHLSYPYVFKYNGSYYMIPETHILNEIRIYRATNFPFTWSYNATLVSGRDFSDSSIFRYNNKWWIFTSDTSHSNCYLYYSNNLTSGWVAHPMSPIVRDDSSKARPGGRAFVFDTNRIIRTVQKDDVVYGEKVRIFEVDTLTETTFVEHEVPESPILQPSGSGWNATGMHQFDPWWTGNHWVCAVDGSSNNGTLWSAGIYIAPHPSAPNGVIDSPAGDITINQGGSVVFNGTGSDPGGNQPLSYRWEFGAGSGISNSTQEDPGTKQFNTSGIFQVTFTVTDALGLIDPTPATRTITVQGGSSVIPKTGWSLKFVDSEETVASGGYEAVNSFDGNINTFWHTKYYGVNPDPPPPHEIQINLGAVYDISGFRCLPRQDGEMNGRIKDWEFYVSTDGVNWGLAAATGTFANTATEKEVLFNTKTGRFIRLRALSEVNGGPWTTMAEINILGSVSSGNQAPNGVIDSPSTNLTIAVGQSVNFAGTGTDPDNNTPLTYLWNFGTGSGISNSTAQDPGLKQFNNIGIFTVTFTVKDALGLADPTPATRTITVQGGSSVIPKAGWSLKFVDSEETFASGGYEAVKSFDDDTNTFWHTRYYNLNPDPPPPHEIQINLGAVYNIRGFRYLQRQDGVDKGRIKQYEFYVSTDGTNWGTAVATGTFANNAAEKEVLFTPKVGQFIRLRALSEVNGNPWTTMAEITVLKN